MGQWWPAYNGICLDLLSPLKKTNKKCRSWTGAGPLTKLSGSMHVCQSLTSALSESVEKARILRISGSRKQGLSSCNTSDFPFDRLAPVLKTILNRTIYGTLINYFNDWSQSTHLHLWTICKFWIFLKILWKWSIIFSNTMIFQKVLL